MHRDNKEDIFKLEDYFFVNINSKNLNVGIVGGGKAAHIKVKSFLEKGCIVSVIANNICDEIKDIKSDSLYIDTKSYNKEFLVNKHLIVVAVNETEKHQIIKDCQNLYKIYLDCSSPKDSMVIMPAQDNTYSVSFGLNTIGGNPRISKVLKEKVKSVLSEYDEFLVFVNKLRNKAKILQEHKDSIIKYISTEEFKLAFEQNKAKESLLLAFPKEIVNYLLNL